MSFEIETRQAVAAMQAAVRECQDVIDLAESEPDETLAGRGYASVVDTMGDMVRILNNGLRRLGEAPVLPAKVEPPAEPEQDPETIARLEEAERKLTAAQAELAKRELMESMVADEPYRFSTSFLQSERLEGEDLAGTDERLRALYTNLVERKPLSGPDDALYKRLHNNLVGLKG